MRIMKRNIPKTVYVDILFCAVILPTIIMLVPVDRWLVKYPLFATLLVLYLYVLYYAIRRAHLPLYLIRGEYWKFATFSAVALTFVYLLSHFPFFSGEAQSSSSPLFVQLRTNLREQIVWLLSLVVIGFSLSVELIIQLFRNDIARSRAELAFYKAQINPHFLFNTLNSIYSLIATKSDDAERAFGKFSEMLRYMYTHADADSIPIGVETDCMRHYIELQRLRLNSHTTVLLDIDIDDPQVPVSPMLLLTFVENAFKYGVSSSSDCQIVVRLSLHGGILEFYTENSVMRTRDEGISIGIENCRSRLALLYPQRYTLHAEEHDNIFTVQLNICLQ